MKDKSEEWIQAIYDNPKGKEYLESKEYTQDFFDSGNTPFDEIKKYDIWNWGNNDTQQNKL